MVKLHDIIGAGLYTATTTRDTPLRLLNDYFFCKPLLNLVKALDALLGFQTRHLGTGSGIVALFLRFCDWFQFDISI
jgi:hypothetical protein